MLSAFQNLIQPYNVSVLLTYKCRSGKQSTYITWLRSWCKQILQGLYSLARVRVELLGGYVSDVWSWGAMGIEAHALAVLWLNFNLALD